MRIEWYFDFISPFAYLAWPGAQRLAAGHVLVPRPILFAAVLDRLGQKGPAEITGKREFTYRFVQFQAARLGRPLRFPPAHPFNPLAALRLCLAAGAGPTAITALFDWIWREGRPGDTPQALEPVAERLGIADVETAVAVPGIKSALFANGEAAQAAGVFGVPTAVVAGERFWGLDALPMLETFLADPAVFTRGEYPRLESLPMAAARRD